MLKLYLSPTMHHAVETRRGFWRLLGLDKAFVGFESLVCAKDFGKQRGFSLLELILVLGLLSIIAIGSVTMLVDDGDWKRQDETEARWDAIRKAIIGEPNLSLNGSPYVAGYVADMGRLPLSVSELIEQNVQFDNNGDGVDDTLCAFDQDNNAGTADINIQQPAYVEIAIPNYQINLVPPVNYTNTVSGGWNGPYLYTAGSSFYGDGWFNQNNSDACDFNWTITTTPANPANLTVIDALRIQSLGSDNRAGGRDTAQDYPANNLNMVSLNEWTLGTAPITFNIQFNRAAVATDVPTPTNPLQLKIYRYIDNGDIVANASDIDETIATTTFEMSSGLTQAPAQTIDLSGLPIGRFAAVIWCTGGDNLPEATANYTNDVVYDGNCNEATGGNAGNIDHSPVYFTVTHHTSQVTITWNLP